MKKVAYIFFIFVFLLTSCSKKESLQVKETNKPSDSIIKKKSASGVSSDITDPDRGDDYDEDGIVDPDKGDEHDGEVTLSPNREQQSR